MMTTMRSDGTTHRDLTRERDEWKDTAESYVWQLIELLAALRTLRDSAEQGYSREQIVEYLDAMLAGGKRPEGVALTPVDPGTKLP